MLALVVALGACGASSGLDEAVVDRVSALAAIGVPPGFEATTSPSNGSVLREFGGVPVDFTGALTSKNRARVLMSSPAPENLQALCSVVGEYLGSAADVLETQWEPEFSAPQCPDLLSAALARSGEGVEPVWKASAPPGEFEVSATLAVGPDRRVLLALDVDRPH